MLNDTHSGALFSQLSHSEGAIADLKIRHLDIQVDYSLISMLKPIVKKDGDQWCVLYGDNLQDGVAGFGDTPHKAVLAFNQAWHQA